MDPDRSAKPFSVLVFAIFTLLFGHVSGPSLAEEVAIPGTSVSLDPPVGFTLSGSFSGLENIQTGSSITIVELPAEAYDQVSELFSDLEKANRGFAQQRISMARIANYSVEGQQVPVLIGRQQIPGGEAGKYAALFRGERTVLLTFNVLDPESLTPSDVEATITSVRLSPAATLDQKLGQLPFSFEAVAPFRIGDILAGSAVILATFEGTDPSGLKPMVIISRAMSAIPASSDVALVAPQLLRDVEGFEAANVTSSEAVVFGGGSANYLEALTEDRKVVLYLRVPPDGHCISLVAFGAPTELERVMSAVAEIAKSVAIRE